MLNLLEDVMMNMHSKAGISAMFPVIQARLVLVLLLVGLAAAVTGCAAQEKAPPEVGEIRLSPTWSVRETVERADAVVIGTLDANLGSKATPGAQPYYLTLYTDYRLALEQVLYKPQGPASGNIAILIRTGIVPTTPGSHVGEIGGFPTFQTGERVLLFLARISQEQLRQQPGHFVPQGFTPDEYYRPLVSAVYGKLVPQGGDWKDSRSGKTVTLSELREAIDSVKKAQ
jgi:hypothetical protein